MEGLVISHRESMVEGRESEKASSDCCVGIGPCVMEDRGPAFRFERLEVWQRAIEFAELVYLASRQLPDSERFGITSQMRRAAVSVGANIAEGSGRPSRRDFSHFLDQAYGSCMEVVSLGTLAARLSYLPHDDLTRLRGVGASVAAMLCALKNSLREPAV